MDANSRCIRESPIYQGEDEQLAYTVTVPTSWGTDPSSPVMTIKSAAGVDVTTDYTSGSASISGAVITTPTILNLVANIEYRLEVKFAVSGGNVEEAWGELWGET